MGLFVCVCGGGRDRDMNAFLHAGHTGSFKSYTLKKTPQFPTDTGKYTFSPLGRLICIICLILLG